MRRRLSLATPGIDPLPLSFVLTMDGDGAPEAPYSRARITAYRRITPS